MLNLKKVLLLQASSLSIVVLAGCASIEPMAESEEYQNTTIERDASEYVTDKEVSKKMRRELNYGYAQLYETADGLGWLDEALLLKEERDVIDQYADRLAGEMKEMQGELDKLSSEIPVMKVNDNGLPLMESRKRSTAQKDRIKALAPFIGKTGKSFERTLLLTLSGALNQTRYLIRVMDQEENIAPLKQFLDKWRIRTDDLYQADVDILNKYYFE